MRLKGRKLREPLALNFSHIVDVGKGLRIWEELKKIFNHYCSTFNSAYEWVTRTTGKELGQLKKLMEARKGLRNREVKDLDAQ